MTTKHLAAAFAFLISLLSCCDAASPQNYSIDGTDSARSRLLSMGKAGASIATAREKALRILQTENSCSAWFREADPDAAGVFASLEFNLDPNGPRSIVELRASDGEMFFRHPYAARVIENGGRHSVITLNPNGPFFSGASPVMRQEVIGSSLHPVGWRHLFVGSYSGDTLPAQMTTLLHELGHVIGRLPDDFDELSGQSGRNTAQVLHFCRAEIKRSARNAAHHSQMSD